MKWLDGITSAMDMNLGKIQEMVGDRVAWEKEMATHSSILAWRILWMEEPGGLLSIGSHRVGHD